MKLYSLYQYADHDKYSWCYHWDHHQGSYGLFLLVSSYHCKEICMFTACSHVPRITTVMGGGGEREQNMLANLQVLKLNLKLNFIRSKHSKVSGDKTVTCREGVIQAVNTIIQVINCISYLDSTLGSSIETHTSKAALFSKELLPKR